MSIELNEKFDELIEKNEDEIMRYFRNYRRGIATKDELECQIGQIFHSYYSFLSDNEIRTGISADNWEDVLADYQKWADGGLPDSKSKNPWLRSAAGAEPTYAASETERALFFRIMSFQKLPIEYYEPMPEDIAEADLHIMVYGTADKWSIYNIADDGGLMNEPEPVGKSFVLTDEYGLKTQIEIHEAGVDNANSPEFKGKGTIEGYTSSTPVDITIWTYKNNIASVNTYICAEDWEEHYNAYRSFPLWQEYFKECEKRNAVYFDCRKAFFEQCWQNPKY